MKLKLLFLTLSCLFFSKISLAQDAGLRFIINNGKIKCGTDLSSKITAYKNDAKIWKGIDADICRAFALAIFDDSNRFEMIHINPTKISKALASNKVDIMLSSENANASDHTQPNPTITNVAYYDYQKLLTKKDNKKSLLEYKNANVCVLADSIYLDNLEEFSVKYDLELKPLMFETTQKAKEAFLLKRCEAVTAGELSLNGIIKTTYKKDLKIIPDVIAMQEVYIHTSSKNIKLSNISKWVINALKLSESYDINSKNIKVIIGTKSASINNLLGKNPNLWKNLQLKPEWVKKAVEQMGNYGEIYESNLGKDSTLKIKREHNKLTKDGGLIQPLPFL